MTDDLRPPYRIAFDNARDPYTARNALGITSAGASVPPTRTITAGAGLTGGGDLSADRTIDVGAGTGITVNANDVALTVPVSVANGGTGSSTVGGGPFVQKAGDTMTGALNMTAAAGSAQMQISAGGGSTLSDLYFRNGTANRWLIRAVNTASESGSNAGSNLSFARYDDAGTLISNAITITRATGIVDFAATPTVAGVPIGGDIYNCGRLEYVSATALSFKPYNGDRIRINGVIYAIPSSGLAGLTNSGLSANTVYYVYAYNNSGTITGEFSATTHVPSATAGNVGTEIKSGDDTRTLIGMARTNASSQFDNTASIRCVISWFNRRMLTSRGPDTAGSGTSSTTVIEINTSARAYFLTWAEEQVTFAASGGAFAIPTGGTITLNLGLDGGTSGLCLSSAMMTGASGMAWVPLAVTGGVSMTEGFRFISPIVSVSTGTCGFYVSATASIRG